MKKIIPVLIFFVASCFSIISLNAANKGFVSLGERWVDFKMDGDVIAVGKDEGLFRKVVFNVVNNDIELYDVKIVLGNGAVLNVPTRLLFEDGQRSRMIHLPGGRCYIRNISFNYRTRFFIKGKGIVRVYGVR